MNQKLFFPFIVLQFLMPQTFAEETVVEKVQVATKTVARAVKKGAHRTSEALCGKGKVKCGAEKIKNRAIEAKDVMVDSSVELKNKVD